MLNKTRPISTWILMACGVWLVGLGFYFIVLRPSLLLEDVRYMGTRLGEIQSALPGLERWLRRVFTAMGGFMMGAGVLTMFVAANATTVREKWNWIVLALAGLFTVGTMSLSNFQLDSAFKWLLGGMIVQMHWTHIPLLALGLWLIAAPFTLGYRSMPLTVSDVLSGLAIFGLALTAMFMRRAWLMRAATLVGLWLAVAPLIFWAPDAAAYANGALVIVFPITLGMIMPMPGPDVLHEWSYNPSTWLQRAGSGGRASDQDDRSRPRKHLDYLLPA